MISNWTIFNRLGVRVWAMLLALVMTMVLGQAATANVLTPVARPSGLNFNTAAQNSLEPELIPALAEWAKQLQAEPVAAPAPMKVQTTLAPDPRWLETLISGVEPTLLQPLAWQTTLGGSSAQQPVKADPATRARVLEAFGRTPLHFEPNQGQTDPAVKFLARAPGYQLLLTPNEAVLAVRGRTANPSPAMVRMQLVGERVNRTPTLEAMETLPAHSNYYLGNDPQRWRTEVPHFAKVRYSQVYPGVDWVLYGNPRQLEYDFVVAPGADPQQIAVNFAGTDAMRVDANGELAITVAGREVLHSSPTIYQVVNGERRIVDGRYVLREFAGDAPVVSFEIAAYDRELPLVIDPIIYFTFMDCEETVAAPPDPCSSEDDFGWDITVDSIGNAYITGSTASDNFLSASFPLTVVATIAGITVNSNLSGILNCTSSSGNCQANYPINTLVTLTAMTTITNPTWTWDGCLSANDAVCLVKMDKITLVTVTAVAGAAPQTGVASTGFNNQSYDSTFNGVTDAFVIRLNIGGGIAYATYLGGTSYDNGYGIALDNQGNFYVTGSTRSADFPVLMAFQNMLHGTQDAFVTKFDVATGQLVYSTFLGGSTNSSGGGGVEAGRAIIVDHGGNAYVTGYTNSTDFPVAGAFDTTQGGGNNPFDPTYNNLDDVFVTKLSPTGTTLVYSTFLGGSGDERGFGIVLDADSNAYVTGYTDSPDFPGTVGLSTCTERLGSANNYEEIFVTKLNVAGNSLGYSTCFGGSRYDRGHNLDIDAKNNVYITGYTDSPNIVGAINPYSVDGQGFDLDAFLARLDPLGKPVVNTQNQPAYFTYFGGNGNDLGYDIAVDCCGSMGTYITGYTTSPDLPLLRADDVAWAGGTEAFITRLDSATGILTYSSFWGGSGNDYGMGIALDAALDVYVTGYANTNKGFPVGPGDPRYRPTAHYVGGYDAFVVKAAIPTSNSFTVSVTGGGTGGGTITSNPAGINCIVPNPATNPGGLNLGDCYESYVPGTAVTLTATPDDKSMFAGWSGDCQLTAPCLLTLDTNKQVVATFDKANTFALSVSKVGNGTVTSNPSGIDCGADCTETYASGIAVTLTATPTTDSVFTGWQGADCSGVGTCAVTMTAAKSVTATFAQTFTLNVTKTGTGSGTVTSVPTGINCGNDCSKAYPDKTSVELIAAPATGSTFSGWSGDCTGTETCVVTMTATVTVTATFNPSGTTLLPDLIVPALSTPAVGTPNAGRTVSFALQVQNQGTAAAGAFRVGLYLSKDQIIDPAQDVNTGNECLFNGLAVGVTAPCSSNFNLPPGLASGIYYLGAYADPYNAVQESNKTNNSRATTNTLTAYTLTVTKTGTGTGTVTSAPFGITCGTGANCVAAFLAGATATLTAAPTVGSAFVSWTGCTPTVGKPTECKVLMNATKAVKANFGPGVPLAVVKSGFGEVNSPVAGIKCGPTCKAQVIKNRTVSLTAAPAAGWQFAGWAGCTSKSGATCLATMTTAKTVRAFFKPRLIVTKTGSGTVTSVPAGINCGATCIAPFNLNSVVTLTARPVTGQRLKSWWGCNTVNGSTCTVNMTAVKKVQANFGP